MKTQRQVALLTEEEFLRLVPAKVAAGYRQADPDQRFLLRVALTQVERLGIPNGRLRMDEEFIREQGWWPL